MSAAYATEHHLSNGYTSNTNGYVNGHSQSMDGRQGEYHQPEPTSAGQYSQAPDVKFNPSVTPTSDYGLTPSSGRSSSFPEYNIPPQRAQYPDAQRYHTAAAPTTNGANMAQPSPSTSSGGGEHTPPSPPPNHSPNSNSFLPLDPSIATASPTYPAHHYSPYGPHHDMPHYSTPPMYPRPEYGGPHAGGYTLHGPYGHMAPAGGHLSTVYSFVPIPGTAQQKRPRRRYEEIERMYKCGHNGCEKAYGTLNHLNAHVTMQSHGPKRTPEEFKEIRKEWKARKKEEDTQRKADEERARQVAQHGQLDGQPHTDGNPQAGYPQGVRQLPPLGYAPANGSMPPQYAQPAPGMDGVPQYSGGQMPAYYPHSPYGQSNQMYQQRYTPPENQQAPVSADRRPTDENGSSAGGTPAYHQHQ